ncbi:MAG: AraC family transcriptional regulator, partial [Hyphomicrobiaceae bacterium]
MPEFSLMALSSASEPLRAANLLTGHTLYECSLIGLEAGAAVKSSGGFAVLPHLGIDDSRTGQFDAVVTVASLGIVEFCDKHVVAWLRSLARQGCAMGAVSVDSLILARAGLLDGFRFTIHWELADRFVEEFPSLKPSRDLYVIDRGRFTCGGVAGLDMMLAIICSLLCAHKCARFSSRFIDGS